MATITLTIPDAVLPRVRAALCANAGLPDTNPNAKQAVIDLIVAVVKSVEYSTAVRAQPVVAEPDVSGLVT